LPHSTAPRVLLAEGEVEDTIPVIRDTTKPEVTTYSPEDGDILDATAVDVEGWVDDGSLEAVTVNDQEAELWGNYFPAEDVPLNTESDTFEELLQNLYEVVEGCLSVDVETPESTSKDHVLEIAI